MNICRLIELAGIDRNLGSYDYAVPQGWLMQDPENRRANYWWYPYDRKKPGHLFGRPLKWAAVARLVLRRLRLQESPEIFDDFLKVWAYAHPGKPLDKFGMKLLARWIEKYRGEHWELCRINLAYCFKGAGVPMPDFIEHPESTSQAA